MTSPTERAAVAVQSMGVCLAQVMGMHPEVALEYTNREWLCTRAAPVVWFGEPFLAATRLHSPWWARTGDYIKLTAANGSWVWKLTGETKAVEGIDGPLIMHRAVWPD